jgi:hypothetical protein
LLVVVWAGFVGHCIRPSYDRSLPASAEVTA